MCVSNATRHESHLLNNEEAAVNIEQGCTPSSTVMRQWSTVKGAGDVAHFAHPIEVILETDDDPGQFNWPLLLLKVSSSSYVLQGIAL